MNAVINGSHAFSRYANGELMHIHGKGGLPTWCPNVAAQPPYSAVTVTQVQRLKSDLKRNAKNELLISGLRQLFGNSPLPGLCFDYGKLNQGDN